MLYFPDAMLAMLGTVPFATEYVIAPLSYAMDRYEVEIQ